MIFEQKYENHHKETPGKRLKEVEVAWVYLSTDLKCGSPTTGQ